MFRIVAMIMAAGSSKRMNGRDKLLLPYKNKTVIEAVIEQFLDHRSIDEVGVVTSSDDIVSRVQHLPVRVVTGGDERQDSVVSGLTVLKPTDFVLIHDGARPFLSADALDRAIEAAGQGEPFVLAVPVSDTLKRVADGMVVETPDRSEYWAAQTPQGAIVSDLVKAYQQAISSGERMTDDSSALERAGFSVAVVPGDHANRKLTTPEDMRLLCV